MGRQFKAEGPALAKNTWIGPQQSAYTGQPAACELKIRRRP